MKIPKKLLLAIAMCALATTANAQPTSRPTPDGIDRSLDRRAMFGEGMGGRGRFGPQRNLQEPSEDEWQDVAAFMKEHSPKRWKMYQTAPEGHQGRLRGPIYSAWKALTRLEREDHEMYDLRVKRLPIEDDIFEIAGEIKKNNDRDPSQRSKLRQKIAAFMDSRVQERKLRIQRLEKSLQQERSALADSEMHREDQIDARTREVAAQGPGALRERPDDNSRPDVSATPDGDQSPRRR